MQIQLNTAAQLEMIHSLQGLFPQLEHKEKIPLFTASGKSGPILWQSSLSEKNFSPEYAHFFKFAHEGVIPIRGVLKGLGYTVTSETVIPKSFFGKERELVKEIFYLEKSSSRQEEI
jgi:hypothetical protein